MEKNHRSRIILHFNEGEVSFPQSLVHQSDPLTLSFEETLNHTLKHAKLALFQFLKTRPRSCYECSQKLKNLGFLDSEIDTVIDDFKNQNYLNDLLFSQYLIESIQNKKPVGELLLRFKLKEKGIDSDMIEEVLSSYFQDEDTVINQAKDLILRRLEHFERFDVYKKWDKMYQYLYSRGFKNDTIIKTLEQIKKED